MGGRLVFPILFLLIALLGCERPSHPPDATAGDSVAVDSMEEALRQRQTSRRAVAADDAELERWSDAVYARADSMVIPSPAQARPLLQKTLRAYRLLGDSARVAATLESLGETFEETSNYTRARTLYNRALERSKMAEARSTTADALHNLGDVNRKKGQYDSALRHYRKALNIRRAIEDRKETAQTLNNIGLVYENQGRYDDAVETYKTSLAIKRDIGDRSGIAGTLNNIGIVRAIQGQYEAAERRWEASLSMKRALGDRTGTAYTLNNLGNIYEDQGQYGKALEHFQQSLQMLRSLEDEEGVASTLNNIGLIHQSRGEYDTALSHYREALSLKRTIDDRRGIPRTLTNMASIFHARGDFEQALEYHQSALEIKRQIGDQRGIANSLNDIGNVYETEGRLNLALAQYQRALEINRQTGNRPSVARNLRHIGTVFLKQGRLARASDSLRRSVHLAERLRQSATSADARRSLLAVQIGAYRALTTTRTRRGQEDAALRSLERGRARVLADHLAGASKSDTSFAIPSGRTLRQTLDKDEGALLFSWGAGPSPLVGLLATRDTVVGRVLPASDILGWVAQTYEPELRRLRQRNGDLIPAALEHTPRPVDPKRSRLAEVIRLYRHRVTDVQGTDSVETALARKLHTLLVDSLDELQSPPKRLVVVPTGILAYLPYETLRDSTGRYLVEDHHIRYAQSLTVLRQLRERATQREAFRRRRRPLLAVGGAAYGSPAPNRQDVLLASVRGDTAVRSERQAATLFRAARKQLSRGKSPRSTYRELGYGEWPSLYGTKLEVQKLEQVLGAGTTVLTERAASEERLRQLNASGKLARYRRVHFATHGIAVPEAPQLSALVLSQQGSSDSLARGDGYLTMGEIVDLELQADVAVLSACRTGIGRIVSGEGVVTLSHAFLRAGANATLVSQWRLLDWSTQQFMTAAYRRARTDDTTFAEAVTDVKRDFIDGTFGARNTDPLRWAPFVYYGHE